jgi:hypothetical protein
MCSRISWCCGNSFFANQLDDYADKLRDGDEKRFFKIRFNRMIRRLEESTKRSSFWYYLLSGMVTVGSIIVPSLISIQDKTFDSQAGEEDIEKHANNIYWSIWAISISVTLSNAFIKLLSLDKTYITRNLRLNQFKSEIMKYLTSSDIYNIVDTDLRFRTLVTNIEMIKRYQVLEEYTPQHEHQNENNERIVNNTTFV